jgi:hypothetical protein
MIWLKRTICSSLTCSTAPTAPYCLHRLHNCYVFTQNVNVSWDDTCRTLVAIRSVVSKGPAVCMCFFFIVRIRMLHYRLVIYNRWSVVVILHASLYICATFRCWEYSDQFVNGFPLQVLSLHCYVLVLYNIKYTIYQCPILHTQRGTFKRNVLKSGSWPASKHEIISKHLKSFLPFIKSINFDLLYWS